MTKEDLIAFESNLVMLWESGKIKCPIHFSGGNEEQLIEIFKEIREDDYKFSTHRNHYHALLSGVSPNVLYAEIIGSDGICKNQARSMGFTDHNKKFYSSAIVGGNCAMAVGVAWSLKESKKDNHVWCFVGDGSLDNGHFWEAFMYAVGWELPITFVLEDNDRATCTTVQERMGWYRHPTVGTLPQLRAYKYKPTYPHVGSGTYVAF